MFVEEIVDGHKHGKELACFDVLEGILLEDCRGAVRVVDLVTNVRVAALVEIRSKKWVFRESIDRFLALGAAEPSIPNESENTGILLSSRCVATRRS